LYCLILKQLSAPIFFSLLIRYDASVNELIDKAPNDTSKEAELVYLKLLRETPLWRKAAMVNSLTQSCQELALAGVRMRYPHASEKEIRMRLAALWLSRDVMMRVFHWDPEHEGY
jgi:hypothetical protein